ncbi:MAG TPA: DUF1080 domain-containing protein [Clostridiales bacterium]|nr:DUF1080 domain-containing protein [Clostridiales bacterium]
MTKIEGYTDTPFVPGTTYHVHDPERPLPAIVRPGTESCADGQPGTPPSDAVILFDGRDLTQWVSCADGAAARWKVEQGYMEVVPGTGSIRTKALFGDCQLHVEWASPTEVKGNGQGRGNSGVFLMGLYEVQVLDCYDNLTYADGTTAGIYGQCPPLANACRRPGKWQTYDILWEAPHFDGEKLLKPAYITILFNGVLVHNHTCLVGPTTYRDTLPYAPHPPVGPLELQDHNNPVRFRNIWYRPLPGREQE